MSPEHIENYLLPKVDMTGLSDVARAVILTAMYDLDESDEDWWQNIIHFFKVHSVPSPLLTPFDSPLKYWPQAFRDYFKDLLLPMHLPLDVRHKGAFMVAESGLGKTTLIENMAAHDFENGHSVVVMDGQGRRELLGRLKDAFPCTVIDTSTGLNIFALPRLPANRREAEILRTNATNLVTDVFSVRLGGMPMTPKQRVPFNFCVQLVMEAGGTIADMYKLMQHKGLENYRSVLPRLSPPAQLFFATQFDDRKVYDDTKKEIILRFDSIMSIPAFARMFSSRQTLDLHSLLLRPGLVLVDTDAPLLGRDGCAVFGRFIINMLVLSGIQRLEMPASQRTDTFFYCDEAADYIAEDANIEYIVDRFRKTRIATLWAVQRERQITSPTVLDALEHCGVQIKPSTEKYQFTCNGEVIFTRPQKRKPYVSPTPNAPAPYVHEGEVLAPPKSLPRSKWGEDDVDLG